MGGDDGSFMLFEERGGVGEAGGEDDEVDNLELPRIQGGDPGDGDEGKESVSDENKL